MRQQWKHYWAALGYFTSAGSGFALWMWQLDGLVTAAILAVVGVSVVAFGVTEFHSHRFFFRWSQAAKERLRWLLIAGVAAHEGWVAWVWNSAQATPGFWCKALSVLLAISAGSAGVAHVVEYAKDRADKLAEIEAAELDRIEAAEREHGEVELAGVSADQVGAPSGEAWAELEESTQLGYRVLASAALDHVSILSTEEQHGGSTLAWDVQMPDAATLAAMGTRRKGRADRLSTSEHGEAIAIAAARVLGEEIESGWVQLYKKKTAGQYRVTLTRWAAMAEVYPYRPVPGGHSVTVPAEFGTRADGQRKPLPVNKHLAIYAGSGSGKSALLHLIIDYYVSSADGLIVAVGLDKFYDLIAEWVEPYLNTGIEPPVLWPAYGPQDAARVVAALLYLIDDRQNRRKSERTALKTISLVIDEQKSLMDHPEAFAWYQGKPWHISDMVARVHMKGNNANVKCVRAGQRSTNDHGGTGGADSNTNTAFVIAGWSNDPAEVGRATGDHKLPNPDTGQWWIKPTSEPSAELMKADYPQESGGDRVTLHDGPTISEIAWSRRDCDNTLDEADVAALGESFAARFTEVTEEFLDYLRGRRPDLSNTGLDMTGDDEDAEVDDGDEGVPAVVEGASAPVRSSDPSPAGQARAAMVAEMRSFLSAVPTTGQDGDQDESTSAVGVDEHQGAGEPVAPAVTVEFGEPGTDPAPLTEGQQRSVRDRVLTVLEESAGPISAGEVIRQVQSDGGRQTAEKTIRNTLSVLTREGVVAGGDGSGYQVLTAHAQ